MNSLATSLIESYALYRLLSDKKLMPHVPRKSTKIMAIALGWALAEITSLRLVKILTSEFQADEFRMETLLNSFTSLFDFMRIVGVTFLVEKMSRRGKFSA